MTAATTTSCESGALIEPSMGFKCTLTNSLLSQVARCDLHGMGFKTDTQDNLTHLVSTDSQPSGLTLSNPTSIHA